MTTKQFWLIQNEKAFFFPFNPESITIESGNTNETFKIEQLGKTTITQPPDLLSISFSSEFPAKYFVGCEYMSLPKPKDAYEQILKMQKAGVVRFIITGFCNLEATISHFKVKEVGGDIDTLYYDIELTEYRRPIIKTVKVTPKPATKANPKTVKVTSHPKRPTTKQSPVRYTVRRGDCLWLIAKRQLGDANKWPQIAKLNNIKPKYIIHTGQVLRLK